MGTRISLSTASVTDDIEVEPQLQYTFDGVNDYATIPDWTPNGLPFTVEAEATPLTVNAAEHVVVGDFSYKNSIRISVADAYQGLYQQVGGGTGFVTAGTAVVGQGQKHLLEFTAAGLSYAGGTDADLFDFSNPSNVWTHIGSSLTPADYFHGPIHSLKLIDNSPIQDTTACFGNATRYVELENPIVLEGDYDFEWDEIRQDTASGTSAWRRFGQAAVGYFGWIWDTQHASSPDQFAIKEESGSDKIWTNALAGVANGQHYHGKVSKRGGVVELFIDEVSKGTKTGATGVQVINTIFSDALVFAPVGAAIQNVIIRDLTNNLTWEYKLDEGQGTAANNTGNTAGGATSYDGAWTPDTDWQEVPDNSRFYPMNDNGSSLRCFDRSGTLRAEHAGTIQNYDGTNWG